MAHHFSLSYHLVLGLIAFGYASASGVATAEEPAKKPSSYVAAKVLDEEVRLRVISPEEVEFNRAKLSEKDFARWQAGSRWRPLVSQVSHLVMSDWAKQNDVQPSQEEIQQHFNEEAKKHLQAFETEEAKRHIAVAVGWAVATSSEWATAKALQAKYGGPIAISSFGGCVSIEGRNHLVKEYAAAGKIHFSDPELEKLFWEGIRSPSVLDVTISDPKRVSQHFERPPWQGWGARTAKWLEQNADLLKASDVDKDEESAN